jgi:cytochrome c
MSRSSSRAVLAVAMLTLAPASGIPVTWAQDTAEQADGAALARSARCYACHDAVRVLIGPPYQAIALRYAADRKAMETVLATKILVGGGGNWGVVPMVPNEHVSAAEARKLARWVLDQAPR